MAQTARHKCECEMEDGCSFAAEYMIVYRNLLERSACLFHCEYLIAFHPQRMKEIRDLHGTTVPFRDIPNTNHFR